MIFVYLFKKEKVQDLFLKYRVTFDNINKKITNCYNYNTYHINNCGW